MLFRFFLPFYFPLGNGGHLETQKIRRQIGEFERYNKIQRWTNKRTKGIIYNLPDRINLRANDLIKFSCRGSSIWSVMYNSKEYIFPSLIRTCEKFEWHWTLHDSFIILIFMKPMWQDNFSILLTCRLAESHDCDKPRIPCLDEIPWKTRQSKEFNCVTWLESLLWRHSCYTAV